MIGECMWAFRQLKVKSLWILDAMNFPSVCCNELPVNDWEFLHLKEAETLTFNLLNKKNHQDLFYGL